MKVKITIFVILSILAINANAQTAKYLVLFKDKKSSPYSIAKPEEFLSKRAISRRERQGIAITEDDFPVNPTYITQVAQTGAKVWYKSRWFNGALVEATAAQLAAIKALSFVSGVEFNKPLSAARVAEQQQTANKFGIEAVPDYGYAKTQNNMLGIDKMHDAGHHGEGMLIAILDAGFKNSNINTSLKPIFDEKRVIYTYDFVKREASVYEDDSHGHNVFSLMASYQEAAVVGPAYKASFMLMRTEDAFSEYRIEEANWLFAAEVADSAGVDIISTSLGYTTFDAVGDNYTYANMDGKTALISRAADKAVATGMVVLIAAGNEGNGQWKYISAPADAKNVIAVGAVDGTRFAASFSSYGPSADGRTKPDVTGMGAGTFYSNINSSILAGSGTSYSTPIMAGMVAGLWQAQPHLSAMDIVKIMRKAGHLYTAPNAQYGYGIPTFDRALDIAKKEYAITATKNLNINISPNPFQDYIALTLPEGQTVELEMFDIIGKKVLQKTIEKSNYQNIIFINETLSTGVYLLRASSSQGNSKVFRLVKL